MRLLDYFSRAYVVNLPERTDRRDDMVRMLARVGMSPRPGKLEFFPGIRPKDAGPFPSAGARGNFLSHLELLRSALREGVERVLVLEDDMDIRADFPSIEAGLVRALSTRSWGFVYFGFASDDLASSPDGLMSSDRGIVGSDFYGVAQPALGWLVDYFESVLQRPAGHPEGGPMYCDAALNMFRERRPEMITLFCSLKLAWQRSSRSDIAPNRWFDRVPVARTAVAELRRWRNHLQKGRE